MKHNQPNAHHFLLTSIFEWQTGTDLGSMMKRFDKERHTYWIWYVPTSKDADYEINFYQPQVEGSICLQEITYRNGRRVTELKEKFIFDPKKEVKFTPPRSLDIIERSKK